MNIPFLSKKEPEAIQGKGFIPIDRVRELSSRGFSEAEIIDVLRKDGFSAEEIDKGLTQSLKSGVTGSSTPTFPPSTSSLPTLEELKPSQTMPSVPETSLPEGYYQSYPTEEYIEYAIQERMMDIHQQMGEFEIRHKELERRMEDIHNQLNQLSQGRGGEQMQILDKIETFKESVNEMETRMASLEKAFKETLPALIESVRALSDLVQRMRREA